MVFPKTFGQQDQIFHPENQKKKNKRRDMIKHLKIAVWGQPIKVYCRLTLFFHRFSAFLQWIKFVKHLQWDDGLWLCQDSRKSVRQNSTFFSTGELERDDGLCLQRHTLFAINNRASCLCAVGLRWWRRCNAAAQGTKQLSLFMGDNQQLIHNVRILHLWKNML